MIRQFIGVMLACMISLQLCAAATIVYAEEVVMSEDTITQDTPTTPDTSTSADGSNKNIPTTPTSISVGTYLKTPDQKISGNIGDFIVRAINFLAMVIGSFSLLVIILGGFILLASGGSESAVQKGKDTIKYAIIGLVIALSAFYITAFVQSIFFENV